VVEAADAVRHRFGERAITRARLVGSRLPAPFEHDPMTAAEARSPRQATDADDETPGVDAEQWPDDVS
jgi:hypothetical protein